LKSGYDLLFVLSESVTMDESITSSSHSRHSISFSLCVQLQTNFRP
jgi:hypothetical protein